MFLTILLTSLARDACALGSTEVEVEVLYFSPTQKKSYLYLYLPGTPYISRKSIIWNACGDAPPWGCLIARRWVGRQTRWWPRHKAIYFTWFGPEFFCLLLGPSGFNCWFSFAPVVQWCCSASRGSPGVGRNSYLSSPHLCFIIVFICDLFVSRDDPLMS